MLSKRRQFALLCLFIVAAILSQLDRQSIAIFKPLLQAELVWSDSDYADIVALYQAGTAVALLFAGNIVDRVGVRWAAPLAVLGASIAMLAHGWARGLIEIGLCRMGLAAFQAVSGPAGLRSLSEMLPPVRRTLGIGIANAAGTVGGIAAPIILPALAALWDWRAGLIVLGAVGIAWSIAWLILYRPHVLPCGPSGGRSVSIFASVRKPNYRTIALAKALSDMTWWVLLFWGADFFQRRHGLAPISSGPYLAGIYMLSALGALTVGATSARKQAVGCPVGQIRTVTMLVGIACVAPLCLADLASTPWTSAALIGLALFGHQGFGVTVFAIMADEAEPQELGRLVGFSQFCGNISGILVTQTVGFLLSIQSGYFLIFLLLPATYVASLLLLRCNSR